MAASLSIPKKDQQCEVQAMSVSVNMMLRVQQQQDSIRQIV